MNKYFDYIMRFLKHPHDQTEVQSETAGNAAAPNRNITVKLLALFVAAGLWLYVMNEQNPPIEARYTIPLEIRNVQSNYVVVENSGSIRVRVRGPRSLVAGTQADDISAYVDMTNLSEGSHNISVHSIIPPSLELIETTPEMALIRLEPVITRTIPVTVDFSGILAKGLVIDKVSAKLNEAVIKGPKHIVDSVDKLTGKIDITGKTSSFSVEAPIIPLGRTGVLVEGLSVSPQVALVEINIQPDVVKKNLEVKLIFTDSLPPGLTLTGFSLDPATVEARENTGGSDVLTNLEYIYTEPVNLSDININTTRTVKINLPTGVTANPDSVKAIINVGRI